MKDKLLQIRVDSDFLQKLEYLRKINGWRTIAETVRKLLEKEYRKETQEVSNNSPELDKENGELISRQAVLDAIFSEPLYESGMKKRDSDIIVPAIYEKIKALPPSPSRPQWIPCSERLPDKPNVYTVTDHDGRVVRYVYNDNESSREYWKRCAKAWMPLPEPYQGN